MKDEALALIDNTRHMSQSGDAAEDEDSMETDSPRSSQKDQRDGVSSGRNDGQDFVCRWSKSQFYIQANELNLASIFLDVKKFFWVIQWWGRRKDLDIN